MLLSTFKFRWPAISKLPFIEESLVTVIPLGNCMSPNVSPADIVVPPI